MTQYTINNNKTGEPIASADSRREAELYISAYKLSNYCYISSTPAGRAWLINPWALAAAVAPYLLAGFIGALITIAIG